MSKSGEVYILDAWERDALQEKIDNSANIEDIKRVLTEMLNILPNSGY